MYEVITLQWSNGNILMIGFGRLLIFCMITKISLLDAQQQIINSGYFFSEISWKVNLIDNKYFNNYRVSYIFSML